MGRPERQNRGELSAGSLTRRRIRRKGRACSCAGDSAKPPGGFWGTPRILPGDSAKPPGGILGYPSRSKDEETRVRTRKSKFQPWLGRGAGTGAFCAGTLKPKDFIWLLKSDCTEPTTLRLTAE